MQEYPDETTDDLRVRIAEEIRLARELVATSHVLAERAARVVDEAGKLRALPPGTVVRLIR